MVGVVGGLKLVECAEEGSDDGENGVDIGGWDCGDGQFDVGWVVVRGAVVAGIENRHGGR